ncbi:MAG: class I tRNA ligase family protein, partial [Chroococcales cyanobacterium]
LQGEDAASRRVAQQTLAFVLEGILKLLHPFIPHITEEIWHTLTQAESTASLAVQSYPKADANLMDGELEEDSTTSSGGSLRFIINRITTPYFRQIVQQYKACFLEGIRQLTPPWPWIPQPKQKTQTSLTQGESLESDFQLIIGAIRTIRNLRAEVDIKPGAKIKAILQSDSDKEREILQGGESYIQNLAKVAELTITPALVEEPEQTIAGVVGTVQVLVPLAGVVDIEQLCAKLEKSLGKIEGEVKSISGRLSNSKFVDKAPPEVVQGARDNLAEAEKQGEILRDRLRQLRGE